MTKYCCQRMQDTIEHQCEVHPDPQDCPDNALIHIAKFDEYGIPVRDGGSSFVVITFCPWCGSRLPESKRDQFDQACDVLEYDSSRVTDPYWKLKPSLPVPADEICGCEGTPDIILQASLITYNPIACAKCGR